MDKKTYDRMKQQIIAATAQDEDHATMTLKFVIAEALVEIAHSLHGLTDGSGQVNIANVGP